MSLSSVPLAVMMSQTPKLSQPLSSQKVHSTVCPLSVSGVVVPGANGPPSVAAAACGASPVTATIIRPTAGMTSEKKRVRRTFIAHPTVTLLDFAAPQTTSPRSSFGALT